MTDLTNQWLQLGYSVDSGAGDGVTTNFVTTNKMKDTTTPDVYLNGIKVSNYTITLATKTVAFSTAPAKAQKVTIKYPIGV